MTPKRGLATCPWCPWQETVTADDIDGCVAAGRRAIEEHNAAAGHKVKPERQPRVGYRRGEPVS